MRKQIRNEYDYQFAILFFTIKAGITMEMLKR